MLLFVTGGTGFIGSHFLRAALEAGHQVVALRRPGSRPRVPVPVPDSERLTWIDGDLTTFLTSPETGLFALAQIGAAEQTVLVHLAAVGLDTERAGWERCFRVNVIDSLNLLRRAADVGIKNCLICGSCLEYGRSGERYERIPPDAPLEPVGAYASSKAAASIAAIGLSSERGLKLKLLRPFHVFGEGQTIASFWPQLRQAAFAGEDFPMTAGAQVRDFTPVELAAARLFDAAQDWNIPPGRALVQNIGTGRPQTLLSFAEHWWQRWGATGRLLPGAKPYRPNEIMRYVPWIG